MRRKRNILFVILILLVALLGALVYALFGFREAAESEVVEVSPGLKHVRSIYAFGADELLQAPWGVAFADGEVYVSDLQLGAVYVFSEDGQFIRQIGSPAPPSESQPGQLAQPSGIGIDGAGDLMVVDRSNRVTFFDRGGSPTRSLAVENPAIPYYADGVIYVTTAGPIELHDQESLQLLTSWGQRGRGDDDFDFANGLARGPDGTVYVSDGNNMRVKAVDADGVQIWSVGQPPESMDDSDRVFGLPAGLVLVDDTLYVADPLRNTIHLISTSGEHLAEIGDAGEEEGFFSYPTQIAYLGSDRFAVTEWGNARVQIVEIDRDSAISGATGG